MSGVHLVKKGRSHFYEHDGIIAPSVTTILKAVNKPALVGWAAKVTAEWAVDNKKMWYGLPDDSAVELLKKARWRGKEAEVGTQVHAAVLEQADVPAALRGYVDAFDDWSHDFSVTRTAAEVPVFGYTGWVYEAAETDMDDDAVHTTGVISPSMPFGGTVDFLGTVDGHKSLVDVKTGKAIYDEYWLQVEAYARATVGLPFVPDRVGILHLMADGEYDYMSRALDDSAWAAFRGAYAVGDYLNMWKAE